MHHSHSSLPWTDIAESKLTDGEFLLFRELISSKTGISLRDTKRAMLTARLQRRLRALKIHTFDAYYQYLITQDPAGHERRELINCITTNKTSFFRESHHFSFLTKLAEAAAKPSSTAHSFDTWSAACSTGEEPFSIAMTLRQCFNRSAGGPGFSVVATDIDTQVLQFARHAIYPESDFEHVPADLRQKFFLRGGGSQAGRYRVKTELRNLIDFRQLNLIDPCWDVSGRFDAIFCRNALIYFEHETQDRILRRLISYLKPGGHLFVGHSEHLHWMTDVLEIVGTTIYRLKPGV